MAERQQDHSTGMAAAAVLRAAEDYAVTKRAEADDYAATKRAEAEAYATTERDEADRMKGVIDALVAEAKLSSEAEAAVRALAHAKSLAVLAAEKEGYYDKKIRELRALAEDVLAAGEA